MYYLCSRGHKLSVVFIISCVAERAHAKRDNSAICHTQEHMNWNKSMHSCGHIEHVCPRNGFCEKTLNSEHHKSITDKVKYD